MVYLNANLSVIKLNLNGLIAPNKIKASHAGLKIPHYINLAKMCQNHKDTEKLKVKIVFLIGIA